nr:unnamed protein product [Sorex araneus]
MNLNTNRSSPHLSTNGVSSFSGKTGPSVIAGAVEVLGSLMQELQNNGKTDSELWKNCETRWLQLFNLVEKQCEEQIVAQQEQFHNQIQRIQEEIKNLVKLQTNNASWAACDSAVSAQAPAESQMGFFAEPSERNDAILSRPAPDQPDMQQEAPSSQPDCSAEGSCVSSGYGTCASELSACKAGDSGHFMEREAEPVGPCGVPGGQAEPLEPHSDCGHSRSGRPQAAQGLSEDASLFPGDLEGDFLGKSQISEVYSGEKNGNKAITSWAQKLKQNQPKRIHSGEDCSRPAQASQQSDLPAVARPPAFYLSKPEELPDSWLSAEGAGLLYWKLEEKDMYHSLPEAFDTSLAPPTARRPSQFNASNEMKPPSLKDIYRKKQRESKPFPERDLTCASHPDHPPEVLTLDPAAHRKPSPRGTLEDPVSSSPDSVLGPTLSSHSDTDSFSQASHVTSQLSGFPKSPSHSKASPGDPWESRPFPHESRTSSSFASVYSAASSDVSVNTVEGAATATVPSVSARQPPIPAVASSGSERISSAPPGDPVLMSQIRQTLKEKHARHVADLRAYYESEINSLKQKLEAKEICAAENWKKTNQILIDSDLRDRFRAASSASAVLQERIEEMRASSKEKDGTILRLQARLQDVEEAFESAYRLSDDKEARLRQEAKMFQDLLLEYESLGKEHERVKETLNTTENKLLDARTQISDLKRTISKLEAQIKQVEHESLVGLRRHLRAPVRPSCTETGLPASHTLATSDVSRRKWLIPGAEYSIFTGQPLALQDRRVENPLEKVSVPGDPRPGSPPTPEPRDTADAPIVKALKQLEEEKTLKNLGTQTEDPSNKPVSSHLPGTPVGAGRSPEKCPPQRPKRQSSAAQRSSSLPPSSRRSSPPARREIMLTALTATYSPKRSPRENLSPGFSHLLSRGESSSTRSDILLDDLDAAPHAGPRRQLQLLPPADAEAARPEGDFEYTAKMRTLAETERFFDELTKEKDQIEAALSRMPSGGRVTLQARLNQEALEERLERVNRELGSIRMTLKKCHVLRTCANL